MTRSETSIYFVLFSGQVNGISYYLLSAYTSMCSRRSCVRSSRVNLGDMTSSYTPSLYSSLFVHTHDHKGGSGQLDKYRRAEIIFRDLFTFLTTINNGFNSLYFTSVKIRLKNEQSLWSENLNIKRSFYTDFSPSI